MKIRVMVVEDEPPIQRSICQKIEETNKNFTVVAAIDNGKDALQYLKEHPVDVMFVDMNLPIVGGKELLDFCSNEELSVLPVVLSGYTDFEYVKCAITNHAIDYLLKPLKVQELKLVLEKIEEKIQKQYLKEKVQNLTDAVRGLEMFPTKEMPSEVNSSYSILLVSLGMCLYENERNYQEIFKNMDLEKAFSLIVPPENFWLVDGKSINEKLIFIRKDSIPDINHLNQFFRKVKCSDIIVTVVYYKETVELPDIFSTYHLLQKYTREHMIFLKNSVLIYSSEEFRQDFSDLRNKIDCLILQCKNANIDNIIESFAQLLHLLTMRPIIQKEALRNIKYFVSEIYKLYPGNREFFEVEEDIFGIAMYDSGDKKIIALKIKNYLDEMFRTNITNQLLAARFGFVPSYIVSIFKTYYGLTPMDYLVKKRIDESKFLLANSSLKIKEVANEVGYEDSLYFSKVFKKITGVSPKEYIRSEKIDS